MSKNQIHRPNIQNWSIFCTENEVQARKAWKTYRVVSATRMGVSDKFRMVPALVNNQYSTNNDRDGKVAMTLDDFLKVYKRNLYRVWDLQ